MPWEIENGIISVWDPIKETKLSNNPSKGKVGNNLDEELYAFMNQEETENVKRLVKAESKRLVTKIFKHSLMALEDIREQHFHVTEDLKEHLTEKQLETLNYLDSIRYSLLRKRILDNGNEGVRDLENFLDNSNFRLLKKYKFPLLFFEDRIYGLDTE